MDRYNEIQRYIQSFVYRMEKRDQEVLANVITFYRTRETLIRYAKEFIALSDHWEDLNISLFRKLNTGKLA